MGLFDMGHKSLAGAFEVSLDGLLVLLKPSLSFIVLLVLPFLGLSIGLHAPAGSFSGPLGTGKLLALLFSGANKISSSVIQLLINLTAYGAMSELLNSIPASLVFFVGFNLGFLSHSFKVNVLGGGGGDDDGASNKGLVHIIY